MPEAADVRRTAPRAASGPFHAARMQRAGPSKPVVQRQERQAQPFTRGGQPWCPSGGAVDARDGCRHVGQLDPVGRWIPAGCVHAGQVRGTGHVHAERGQAFDRAEAVVAGAPGAAPRNRARTQRVTRSSIGSSCPSAASCSGFGITSASWKRTPFAKPRSSGTVPPPTRNARCRRHCRHAVRRKPSAFIRSSRGSSVRMKIAWRSMRSWRSVATPGGSASSSSSRVATMVVTSSRNRASFTLASLA